jgi:hypothetical protein
MTVDRGDLSPEFHPAMGRVPVTFALSPFSGPPEGRVFRLFTVAGWLRHRGSAW